MKARMLLATFRALAPGSWKMTMVVAGLPARREKEVYLLAPSSVSATSRTPQDRAVRQGADDDVAEFLLVRQAALDVHAVLKGNNSSP
jgi:hypothetical protein